MYIYIYIYVYVYVYIYIYAHVDPDVMRVDPDTMHAKLLAVYMCLWRQQLSCIQCRLFLRMVLQKCDVFYCMATRPRSLLVVGVNSYAPLVFNLKDSVGTDVILEFKKRFVVLVYWDGEGDRAGDVRSNPTDNQVHCRACMYIFIPCTPCRCAPGCVRRKA